MRLITVICRYLLILSLIISLLSCEDYLSVELNNAISMDEVFNKRQTTEQYLAQVYGFLPNETDVVSGEGSVIPRSDEGMFSWLSGVAWLNMNNGSWALRRAPTEPGKAATKVSNKLLFSWTMSIKM